jgi:hypothetical protein
MAVPALQPQLKSSGNCAKKHVISLVNSFEAETKKSHDVKQAEDGS